MAEMGALIIQQVNPTAPKQQTYETANSTGITRDEFVIMLLVVTGGSIRLSWGPVANLTKI